MRKLLVLVFALSGCSDDDGAPSWARATGWFSSFRPDDVSCALVGRRDDTQLWVTFERSPSSARLVLPKVPKGERYQREAFLRYGTLGQTSRALIDLVRGDVIVDPRLNDEAVRARSLALRTSLYFPVTARRVRINPGHLCNVNVLSGFVEPDDCIDVPEDSTLEDAHFWCHVGGETDPSWTE